MPVYTEEYIIKCLKQVNSLEELNKTMQVLQGGLIFPLGFAPRFNSLAELKTFLEFCVKNMHGPEESVDRELSPWYDLYHRLVQ